MKVVDHYQKQLRESHATRFERLVNSWGVPGGVPMRQRIAIKKLYKEIIKELNIYRFYDVPIEEFAMAMLQGKLHLVELDVDHSMDITVREEE